MKHRGCSYRGGVRGRSFTTRPGVGGPTCTGHLTCSGCGTVGETRCRTDATPRHLDDKFRHAGWKLDPHICPDCQRRSGKETDMAMPATPSAAAMKAQAKMFRLLTDHFDEDAGRFEAGWDDKRVAAETGLKAEAVVEFRRAGFGEIKEAPELAALRADITALETLQREHSAAFATEIAGLRGRLGKLVGAAA